MFGLAKIQRPEVMEVTDEDLVVGCVSQTAQRMKEVCEAALGGVLFIRGLPAGARTRLRIQLARIAKTLTSDEPRYVR